MATRSKLWYLKRFPMLHTLSDEQLRAVEQVARYFEAPRGEAIYTAGDPSDSVFLLKSGVIRMVVNEPGRPDAILAFLFPGDVFGELAVVDESPRDHAAVAHEDVVLCAVAREDLLRMMRDLPSFGYEITKAIGSHLRSFRTRVADLLYQSAPARVARALLLLAESSGIRDADGILVPVRLSQSDLAHLTGLSRETVNAVMQEFREHGLAEHSSHSIRVRQPDALARIR
jgi:CRP/FNR family cyclic AMP-dependent transcriptional regulator